MFILINSFKTAIINPFYVNLSNIFIKDNSIFPQKIDKTCIV